MTMKVIYVPQKGMSREMEFESIEDILAKLKITEKWETMQIEDEAYAGIGIIAQDQEETTEEENRLGIKGPFVLIGMTRLGGDDNLHAFEGLTAAQADDVRLGLTLQTYRDLNWGAEI